MQTFFMNYLYNKEDAMRILGQIYDEWRKEELDGINRGCGMRGIDFSLTTDIKRLFNQLMYSI